jgi:DNA repair exonuclease SbcCD ATPase subunit
MTLEQMQSRIDRLQHESYAARKRLKDEREAYQVAQQHLRDAEQARSIAQQVAQAVQQQAHAKIAGVVTTCLKSVFGEDSYEFKIKFLRKRNRTEAQLVFVKDGEEVTDPLNEDSGGVVDIAAFALRLACLMLAKPRLRRLLVLDEPFRFVSAGYRESVRQMLLKLAEDFYLQIVMVTHIEELMCGKVIEL